MDTEVSGDHIACTITVHLHFFHENGGSVSSKLWRPCARLEDVAIRETRLQVATPVRICNCIYWPVSRPEKIALKPRVLNLGVRDAGYGMKLMYKSSSVSCENCIAACKTWDSYYFLFSLRVFLVYDKV